jgi:hypothetical protein
VSDKTKKKGRRNRSFFLGNFFLFFFCLDSLCKLLVSKGERHVVVNRKQRTKIYKKGRKREGTGK